MVIGTCTAKDRITEVEGEIRFIKQRRDELYADLGKKQIELEELKRQFKLPTFFKNIPVEEWNYDDCMVLPLYFDKKNPIHVWMYNHIRKTGGFQYMTLEFTYSATQIETLYNYAVKNYSKMKGYPEYPEEFIIK